MRRSKINVIGRLVEVINSTNPCMIGIKGVVLDETRNMLYVRTERGLKKLPKVACHLRVYLDDGSQIDVDGRSIIGRIDERLKA